MSLQKIAGISGLLFWTLSGVIVWVVPLWPVSGADAPAILAYYREHGLPFLVGNWIAVAAVIPAFCQTATLAALVKRREGADGWLWMAVAGSSFVTHAVGIVALTAQQAIPHVAESHPSAAVALSELATIGLSFFLIPLAGHASVTAAAILRSRVLPRWIGHLGWVVALLALAASAGTIWPIGANRPGGLASALAFGAYVWWIFFMSVAFLRARVPDTVAT